MASLSPSEVQYQQEHIHEDKAANIIAACGICITAAYLAVILRFVSRRLSKTSLQSDDYTIVIALVRISFFIFGISGNEISK